MKKKYKLLIFDWDGTIIDSQAHIIHCMSEGIKDAGFAAPDDNAIRHIIGLSLERAAEQLMPACTQAEIETICDNYRQHFFSTGTESSGFYDGAEAILQQCVDAGYYMAVATGKSRRGLDMVLEAFDLNRLFHITRCADETASKPHPMMLEEILTDLDLTPNDALMIGDTTYDMNMANNAKMDSMAVTYGVHERTDLETTNPTYFLEDIKHLFRVLDNI